MINPYEKCPVYENENYMLRMVRKEDKEDLLKDEKKKDGIYISAKDGNIEELKDAILSLLELDQEVYHLSLIHISEPTRH